MPKEQKRVFTAEEKRLAEQARDERRTRDMTQQQVADAAGVSLGVVSNFERFVTYPNPGNLRAIRRVLGIEAPDVERAASSDQGALDVCPACNRVRWPDTYELVFDILGAYMDTLDASERRAFQRRITAPVHGVE